MSIESVLTALEALPIAGWMRESESAFPWVEAIHVVAIVLVVGTIAIVDLRLINVASRRCAVTEMTRDTLPWTWVGFVIAVITGLLMFISKAHDYWANTMFQLKMLTLLLAGVNMAVFEFLIVRSVSTWDKDCPVPTAAKVAGSLSLMFWIAVVGFGRWIGFTIAGNF